MHRRWAGVLLGIGLGGILDGIVLHQIAQWHNMGSAVLPPTTIDAMSRNVFWDGLFHAAVWCLTVVGVFALWANSNGQTQRGTATAFCGQMLFGWGIFNLAEGVVNHHLLQLHHVRDLPTHVPLYDWLFLLNGGFGLLAVGWMLMATDAPVSQSAGDRPGEEAKPPLQPES